MAPGRFDVLVGLRVLVVEDEHLIALALADEFEAAGALVLGPASSVQAAMELVLDGPQAAVLDLELQGKLVTPVVDALQARSIPFILTTGYDAAAVPPQCASVPRCTKPTSSIEVLEVLCSVVRAAGGESPR